MDALDAIDLPVALREPGGRIRHLNPAARAALGNVDAGVLTRIQRSRAAEGTLFLLSLAQKALRRVRAQAATVRAPNGDALELLLLARDAVAHAAHATPIRLRDVVLAYHWPDAGLRRIMLQCKAHDLSHGVHDLRRTLRHLQPVAPELRGLAWSRSRVLLAALLRRVRRHRRGARVTLVHELARDDRSTRASVLALSRLVLSAVDVLGASASPAHILARHVGCRLCISVARPAPPPLAGAGAQALPRPDLRTNRVLLRELSPLLAALGATLELIRHDASGATRIDITLPTSEHAPGPGAAPRDV